MSNERDATVRSLPIIKTDDPIYMRNLIGSIEAELELATSSAELSAISAKAEVLPRKYRELLARTYRRRRRELGKSEKVAA